MGAADAIIAARNDGSDREPVRYEDVYAWALAQSDALRQGRFEDLDLPNLADEVSDIAEREYDRLEGVVERLLHQSFVWDHEPGRRTASRERTSGLQRKRVERRIKRCPSLVARRAEALREAYPFARLAAQRETDLPRTNVPADNPHHWGDAASREGARGGDTAELA